MEPKRARTSGVSSSRAQHDTQHGAHDSQFMDIAHRNRYLTNSPQKASLNSQASSYFQPELVTGISPHSDAVALTILLQANETEGLQVKKDGVWIPVSPLPNAFVINIEDILEIVTNGVYRSIEHKVTVNSTKERLSIATFLSPSMDGEVGPTASLVTPQTPAKFKTIKVTEYLK
ncbi:putative 2-oxoglutarate/Fe(II)-dependent dioxygenase [Sesamum alatum]|uniref:2-oxoglutarate/Fe(II)-dependent dioxygenase n=1 Tax=Sesamum alatum TaxID=300844 RepID=A0AAE1YZA0_9LAMI|nr:putative 2-oxoglutarate/Fe(II)-dependent dioxygenase [Sesamum alatum]